MPDLRLCLICRRPESDAIHGRPRKPDSSRARVPGVFEYHAFDPGERRRLVRRMDDRVRLLQDAERRVADRRTQ